MKREPLKDKDYFLNEINERKNSIAKREKKIIEEAPNIPNFNYNGAYLNLYNDQLKQFNSMYSAGYNMEDLKVQFINFVGALNNFIENRPEEIPVDYLGQLGVSKYTEALFIISIALLLNVEDHIINEIDHCLNLKNRDILYDKLVSKRINVEYSSDKLNYPKVYKKLLDLIDSAEDSRPASMQKFLKGWYNSLKSAPWHDRHKKSWGFTGYWSWEAAAVTYVFNLDDSTYRDMLYYPKDIVDHARGKLTN